MKDIKKEFRKLIELLSIVIVVWSVVTIYAMLHNQYIVRIAPEHFTIYHCGLEWLSGNDNILALGYAFLAAISPGLFFGFFLGISCRFGELPKVSVKLAVLITIMVIVIAEIVSIISGLYVYFKKEPLYPLSWCGDYGLPVLITNTIQMTCYIMSILGAGLAILITTFVRNKNKSSSKITLINYFRTFKVKV